MLIFSPQKFINMKILSVFFLSILFSLSGTQTDSQDIPYNNTNETGIESAQTENVVMDVAYNDTANETWEVMYYGVINTVSPGGGATPLTAGTDCSTGIKARLVNGNCYLTFTTPTNYPTSGCGTIPAETTSADFAGEVASPTICASTPGFTVYTKITITFND